MSDDAALIKLVLLATWSLEEAAHLVHEINPKTNPVELTCKSNHPVDRTYAWLKKELKNGHISPLLNDAGTPRFSPGTIMRRLEEKDHYVSKKVRRIYDAAHGHAGTASVFGEAKEIYLTAADLIWEQSPGLPAAVVAKILHNELPSYFTKNYLPVYAEATIRKWLKGKGPGKPGRPPKNAATSGLPDIKKIVSKLNKN